MANDPSETSTMLAGPSSSAAFARTVEVQQQTSKDGDLPRGTVVGRYVILNRIGQGGMGVVYAAYDPELDRKLALKLLTRSEDPKAQGRLLREAQSVARLQHPNIVAVYDVGALEDRVYMAMEFIVGTTLAAWLKERSRGWREILDVFMQAAEGLAAVHAAGLVHRDFKPENAMIDARGRVRLMDFGLARADAAPVAATAGTMRAGRAGKDPWTTQSGAIVGTPAYMAPEQWEGKETDPRTDIFSFCVALWEGLYGARPFVGSTLSELAASVFAGPPRVARSDVPAAVARVLHRGLAVRPSDRPSGMPELIASLTRASRRRGRSAAFAAVAIVAAGSAVGAQWLSERDPPLQSCVAATSLVGIWDSSSRDEVRRAILDTGAPFAADAWVSLSRTIDTYAAELERMLTRACWMRQHEVLADDVQALHDACLEQRQGELVAVTDVLKHADKGVVQSAGELVVSLGRLDKCMNIATLRAKAAQMEPPADATTARAVESLRKRLAVAEAELRSGRFLVARDAAAAIVEEADRLGYPPLRAEALLRLGAGQGATGDREGAREALLRAFAVAEEARHDTEAAAVAVMLVHVYGVRFRDLPSAQAWKALAEAKLNRIGDDPRLRVRLLNFFGSALVGADRLSEAVDVLKRALELAAPRVQESPLDYTRVLNSLASTLTDLDRLDEAEPLLREALDLRVQHLGPSHPDVAVVQHNLAKLLYLRRDYQGAIALMRRALAVRERTLEPQHTGLAETVGALAVMLCEGEATHECIALHQRSLALAESSLGANDLELVNALSNLGNAFVSLDKFAEAEQYFDRAVSILTANEALDTLDAALVYYNQGLLELRRGEPTRAAEKMRKVLRIRTPLLGASHVEVGFAWSHLAVALLRSGSRSEAMAAARQSREVLVPQPQAAPELMQGVLVEAEILWPNDHAAARALVTQALATLQPDLPEHNYWITDANAWMTAHPE